VDDAVMVAAAEQGEVPHRVAGYPVTIRRSHAVSRRFHVGCRRVKDRELEAKVMRFVREIGIAPEGKVRTVGFDLTRRGHHQHRRGRFCGTCRRPVVRP
jgi:hypothetical protein